MIMTDTSVKRKRKQVKQLESVEQNLDSEHFQNISSSQQQIVENKSNISKQRVQVEGIDNIQIEIVDPGKVESTQDVSATKSTRIKKAKRETNKDSEGYSDGQKKKYGNSNVIAAESNSNDNRESNLESEGKQRSSSISRKVQEELIRERNENESNAEVKSDANQVSSNRRARATKTTKRQQMKSSKGVEKISSMIDDSSKSVNAFNLSFSKPSTSIQQGDEESLELSQFFDKSNNNKNKVKKSKKPRRDKEGGISESEQPLVDPNDYLNDSCFNFCKFYGDKRIRGEEKILLAVSSALILLDIAFGAITFSGYLSNSCFGSEGVVEVIDILGFILSVFVKIECVFVIKAEITKVLSWMVRLPLFGPSAMMGMAPNLVLNLHVYSYVSCTRVNPVFAYRTARKLSISIGCFIVFIQVAYAIYTQVSKQKKYSVVIRNSVDDRLHPNKNLGLQILLACLSAMIVFLFIMVSVVQIGQEFMPALFMDCFVFWTFTIIGVVLSIRKYKLGIQPFQFNLGLSEEEKLMKNSEGMKVQTSESINQSEQLPKSSRTQESQRRKVASISHLQTEEPMILTEGRMGELQQSQFESGIVHALSTQANSDAQRRYSPSNQLSEKTIGFLVTENDTILEKSSHNDSQKGKQTSDDGVLTTSEMGGVMTVLDSFSMNNVGIPNGNELGLRMKKRHNVSLSTNLMIQGKSIPISSLVEMQS